MIILRYSKSYEMLNIVMYMYDHPTPPYTSPLKPYFAVSVQYSRMYNIEESRMYSTYDYIALTGKSNVYIRHFSS